MQAIINVVHSPSFLKKINGKTVLEKLLLSLIKNNTCRVMLIGTNNSNLKKITQKKWILENIQIDFVPSFEEAIRKSFMNSFFIAEAVDGEIDHLNIENPDKLYSFINKKVFYLPYSTLKKINTREEFYSLPFLPSQISHPQKKTKNPHLLKNFSAFFYQIKKNREEKKQLKKQYKSIKACLFDFDGTLVDDMDDFADLAAKTIEKYYGIHFKLARKKYVEFTGLPFILQLHSIFPGAEKNDEVSHDFETAKESIFFSKHIEPNVRNTLNWLKEKGIKISVTSGGFKDSIDEFCKKEGVEFDLVMGYEKGFEKGPTHFTHLLKTFDLKKEEVLFMGDSLKDAEKGLAYGFRFIAKCGTFSQSAFLEKFKGIETIHCISELKKRLK